MSRPFGMGNFASNGIKVLLDIIHIFTARKNVVK